MDLSKFEKIKGLEALIKLAENERIYNGGGSYFFLDSDGLQAYDVFMDVTIKSQYRVDDFINHDWYIPKPFDVRQAMRDKPDEWVGAFKHQGSWLKVGLNLTQMEVVVSTLKSSALVKDCSRSSFNSVDVSFLDNSIDLNDVPLEAVL